MPQVIITITDTSETDCTVKVKFPEGVQMEDECPPCLRAAQVMLKGLAAAKQREEEADVTVKRVSVHSKGKEVFAQDVT